MYMSVELESVGLLSPNDCADHTQSSLRKIREHSFRYRLHYHFVLSYRYNRHSYLNQIFNAGQM